MQLQIAVCFLSVQREHMWTVENVIKFSDVTYMIQSDTCIWRSLIVDVWPLPEITTTQLCIYRMITPLFCIWICCHVNQSFYYSVWQQGRHAEVKKLKLEYILISWNMHTPSYLVALCISTCLATRKYDISGCAAVTDVLILLPANRKPITHTLSNNTAHCWRHTELLLLIWLWLSVTSQHK